MTQPLRVIVLGLMGRIPVAGVAWQGLHFLEGFRRLGCDVYYIEDTGHWAHDPDSTARYLAKLMSFCGLDHNWAYCASGRERTWFGLSSTQVLQLLGNADALVSVCCPTVLREEHLRVPVRIYLETDPVAPQISVARGDRETIALLDAHTHHFTYAENLNSPDCTMPRVRFEYRPTRQPVVLDWWVGDQPDTLPSRSALRFTTISSWRHNGRDIEWNGEQYAWSKDAQFLKLLDLPRRAEIPLELALACGDRAAPALLETHGWRIVDALRLSSDIFRYRDYISESDAEFTVAKDQYVRARSGWFSDRSACYLAAGKPVVTQATGFEATLPTGKGLFAFRTMDDAVQAVQEIKSDYATHASAARAIAETYFAAERVLGSMLEQTGLRAPRATGVLS